MPNSRIMALMSELFEDFLDEGLCMLFHPPRFRRSLEGRSNTLVNASQNYSSDAKETCERETYSRGLIR